MDFTDMTKMSEKEIEKEVESLNKKLYELRLKTRMGEEKKNHLVKQNKKTIARLKTAQSTLRRQPVK